LDSNGIIAEASATPGLISSGKFSNRENIFDWSRAHSIPHHPNVNDCQSPGNMTILEMSISSLKAKKPRVFRRLVNKFSGNKSLLNPVRVAKWLRLTPHNSFCITPWWSNSLYLDMIKDYGKKTREEGTSFLIDTLPPCDILDPKTGAKTLVFEKCILNILEAISSLDGVDVNFYDSL
jgi:hypothetical protein